MKEKRLRSLVALGVLPLALVACGSATNDTNNGTPPGGGNAPGTTAGSGNTPGAGGSGAGVGTGTGGGSIDNPPPPGECVPGIPVTTQIPMLLNRQYASVVRDLLGVTTVDGTQPV